VAKVKYTKNELKKQRDDLGRYRRFLPTLQLKKRQLQSEVMAIRAELERKSGELAEALTELESWQELFSGPVRISDYLRVERVVTVKGNVVGVSVPELGEIVFDRTRPDYFSDPMWLDDGLDMLEKLVRLEAELKLMRERLELVEAELLVTTQRVNLFEKVKVPEALENIRRIRIFLGDQQTAAVARAKLAKSKTSEPEQAP
jgi:V/A-type H+-transporting ATPase subunit D